MKIDPNSVIPTAFETRVTRRGVRLTPDGPRVQVSTRSDFIAPDLSAPATTAVEQTRGLAGWTIRETAVTDLTGEHRPAGLADRELSQYRAGTPIRRNRTSGMRSTYNPGKRNRAR